MITKKKLNSFVALMFGVLFICTSVVWTSPTPFPPVQMEKADPNQGQKQQTWTGTIKKDDAGKFVLVTADGKTFQLTPEEQVAGLVDKSVKVTGTLKGEVITVISVEPVE